jgi:CDP-glucose 4,6-dehydratase
LEELDMNFWRGKRVLVTGHTGFKGAWLTLALCNSGAIVTGLSLEPEPGPNLFRQFGLQSDIDHQIGDIRDAALLQAVVNEARPEIVLHLAAQSLVRRSYLAPVETWSTNVMGTINLLEALRNLAKPCAAVLVTTDKVYENRNWSRGYCETDPLGGHDPYSASKAGTEIAIASWRRSFFGNDSGVRIASARAGNVIGGGDWSKDRILPDIVRALAQGLPISVRNPQAIRPWQHVLEALNGYLTLAQALVEQPNCNEIADAFNFGPGKAGERTVKDVVESCLSYWPGHWKDVSDRNAPHEAAQLALDINKADALLGWKPRWGFDVTVRETMNWYRTAEGLKDIDIRDMSLRSFAAFEATTIAGNV